MSAQNSHLFRLFLLRRVSLWKLGILGPPEFHLRPHEIRLHSQLRMLHKELQFVQITRPPLPQEVISTLIR
jgi:hypothetical protein